MNAIKPYYLDEDEDLDEYLSFESYSSDSSIEESDVVVENQCCCVIN
jgi:hypothetical protein